MTRRQLSYTLLAIVGAAVLPLMTPRSSMGEERARDWQAWAEAQPWRFDSRMTDPLTCALMQNEQSGEWEVSIRVLKHRRIAIDVGDGTLIRHSWLGHRNSVFAISNDRLFLAEFRPNTCGAAIVAVDLKAGRVLWREPLRAVGQGPHSAYGNLINLGVGVDGDCLFVWGDETFGRYIEVKRLKDGKTVGHRKYAAK